MRTYRDDWNNRHTRYPKGKRNTPTFFRFMKNAAGTDWMIAFFGYNGDPLFIIDFDLFEFQMHCHHWAPFWFETQMGQYMTHFDNIPTLTAIAMIAGAYNRALALEGETDPDLFWKV